MNENEVKIEISSIRAVPVGCKVRKFKPELGVTISDDFDLDRIVKVLKGFSYYRREREDCPFARGNWIIDLYENDTDIFLSLKLPLEMTEDEIIQYIQPLIEVIEEMRDEEAVAGLRIILNEIRLAKKKNSEGEQ